MSYLTNQPLWLSAALLLVPTTIIAMAGPIIVRRYVNLDRLRTNNEVAGFKFATVGVLFAVLLAFAVIVVWEKFNEADNDVAKEASAAAAVYRLSQGIGEPGAALRNAVTAYLKAAIAQDWPAMERGTADRGVTESLDNVYTAILAFHPGDGRGSALFAEILHQLDNVTQARRARLVMASGIVPGIVWLVLFSGATLTVGFTFFFGTTNLRAQSMMTGILSILIFSGLLTIIAIDQPFAGSVKVGPEALAAVLQDFGGASRP
jgi:hypothetical protein